MRYLYFITMFCAFHLNAQNQYYLYGIDYVDTTIKYFDIEYDSISKEILIFDPKEDSFIEIDQEKQQFDEFRVKFPDSLILDTTIFNISQSSIVEKKLLYKIKWNNSTDSIFIFPENSIIDSLTKSQNVLVFKRKVNQSSRIFLSNCEWGNCGSFKNDWDLEWWVKTKYKGKKRIKLLNNRKVYVFQYYYKSPLDHLKWKSTLYLDEKSLSPVGLTLQKLEWKYDKNLKYLGVDTKTYLVSQSP